MTTQAVQSNKITYISPADYVPIVSTVKSLVHLFKKCFVIPMMHLMNPESIKESKHYTWLQQRSFSRCIVLLVPILGNILVGIYDLLERKRERKRVNSEIKSKILAEIKKAPDVIKKATPELIADTAFMVEALKTLLYKDYRGSPYRFLEKQYGEYMPQIFDKAALANPQLFYTQFLEQLLFPGLLLKPESLDTFKNNVRKFVRDNASNWPTTKIGYDKIDQHIASPEMDKFFYME